MSIRVNVYDDDSDELVDSGVFVRSEADGDHILVTYRSDLKEFEITVKIMPLDGFNLYLEGESIEKLRNI